MNITINQITNQQETVPNTVLTKILTVKRNGGVVNLTGNIYIPAAYVNEVLEFCTYFGLTEDENTPGTYRGNDIILSVGTSYISFEDNEVARIINGTFGSDGHITLQQARDTIFTSSTFQNNTVIQTFPEFNLFTKANVNPPVDLFRGCTNLEEIDLSQTTKISDEEFMSSGIKEVDAPSLIEIGQKAFIRSSVETVTSLGNIVSIPFGCFMYCNNLQTVQLPSSVITISPGAFSLLRDGDSSLTYINLNSVISIDNSAFLDCKLLNIDASDLSNLVSIGQETFSSCFSIHGELNMPNLISAGNNCFNSCSGITKVKCLGKITTIPEFFMVKQFSSGMALTEVYLPYECTSIQWNGFNGCSALTTIKQYTQSVDNWVNGEPSSYGRITRITTFGRECFYNCTSLTITIEDIKNAVTIGQYAFQNCSLLTGTLNLPNLVSLGDSAFQQTNITSITDLGSITSIPNECFKGCNVSSINQSVVDQITSWGFTSLYVSGNAALTIKPGPNTKRIAAGIIGVNNPNAVVYLPLITRSISSSPNDVVDGDCYCPFNKRYNSGVARNVYGQIYMPNLSTIAGGYGTFPYQNGLAVDTNADLFYIKSVSTLTPGTFSQCDISHIVINNTTPPNLVDTQGLQNELGGQKKCIFSYNGSLSGIYVPDSAVNSYKTAWGDVLAVTPVNNTTLSQDIIKPISSLNNGVIYATENDWISDGRPSALIAEYMGLSTADLATFVSANNLTYYTPPSS